MKTLFKSQDLWKFVEKNFEDADDETWLGENQKKASKAIFFI